jgi:hypothetical protein
MACGSILLLLAGPASATPVNKAQQPDFLSPRTSTFAGDGTLGTADGPAVKSSFMEPVSVATGPDGSTYVADAAAQNIRRIHNRRVDTVAGFGVAGPLKQWLIGSYRDGPARAARFNRPVGLAVTKDGTIYVADANNERIRKIRQGIVSTFAGSGQHGSTDGTGAAASFSNMKGLAADADGNLYVADFGNGVRKISPAGDVTTLDLRSNRMVLGIAAAGSGNGLLLAYTDTTSVHLIGRDFEKTYSASDMRKPAGEGLTMGFAYAIGILSRDSVVITDLITNSVRFVRFDEMRGLAGGFREGGDFVGGFRDGPSEIAKVDVPYGLAVARDGSIIVADSGNRRIRRIEGVSAREAIQGVSGSFSYPPGSYRIALVGNSMDFCCSAPLWRESMAGVIEDGLLRNGPRLGLRHKAYVNLWRLDATTLTATRSFVSNILGNGQVDLVILIVNEGNTGYEIEQRPELNVNDLWKSQIPRELHQLRDTLAKDGTKLLLAVTPDAMQVSPLERAYILVGTPDYDYARYQKAGQDLVNVYRTSGVQMISLLEPIERLEESAGRLPLFNTSEGHLSRTGGTVMGEMILSGIEQWKPWLAPAGAR